MLKPIITILAVGAIAGGGLYAYNAYRVAKNMTITHNFRVFDVTAQGLRLNGEIFINNPVGSTIDMEYPQVNLYLEGSQNPFTINSARDNNWFQIVPNGQTTINDLNFVIPFTKLIRLIANIAKDKKIKLKAEIFTAVRRGLITIPIKETKNIEIDLPTNILDVITNRI